ncbi:MAG: rhodanese-like domain-containing protein [Bacteroidales bacterium]|jgi:rhodanese-related sulfurtransferase|nr:rhodanese-like domain-containing protein [Bacteroidales bacterium]
MFTFIKKLFSSRPAVDYGELIKQGATIVDVRSKGEYQSEHLKGSINIPLKNLSDNLSKIKKNKPVITCCASGARSGVAKSILKAKGYEAFNGGPWESLKKYSN